ncbi:MAG: hypothetical protein KKB88_01175 [Nanoarchaeota archaeon]|nr:hypothetical protein [Nanoarchaeota archaeon]
MNFDYRKKENLIKIGAILLFVISLLILIGWRYANPDLSLRNPLIVMIIMTILSLIAFFSQKLFKKEKTEDDIPEPMSKEEIIKKLRKDLPEERWNNLANERGIECIDKLTLEKQDIYAYKIKMNGASQGNEEFIAIINANYPEQDIIQLKKDESEHYIRKRMKSASKGNVEEPDIEESEEGVDNFGKPIRKTKKITHKKEKKEEKPDVE